MFFPRLRSQAKWAFVVLIVVFAGGFVFLGVGSGGLDLGQLLRDAFGNKGSSSGSVSSAQKAVQERPLNAPARRHLAEVLEAKGRTQEAISAWLQYGRLRPKDVTALRRLGDLELNQANVYLQQAQLASLAQSQAGVGAAFQPTTGKLGQELSQNPIASAESTRASAELQTASANYQGAASAAITTYKQIVKLQPTNQEALFSLAQAADSLQQTKVAIDTYARLLKLDLDPTTKAQIRQRIKTLRQSLPGAGG
jgi:tetratricopeptide (TPR) repeat protein